MLQRTRTYECMCLLDNREVRKGWEQLKDAVAGMFTKHGAKILSNRRWDERRLAYSIKGQVRGTYLLIYFSADTQTLQAIRRELQFSEVLLRSLLLECPEVPQQAYEPEAAFDVNAIPADDAADEPAEEAAAPEVSEETEETAVVAEEETEA
jgi:small subunit ribosomal protein S6